MIFTGFYGADGFTIIVENKNIQIIYAHVSPLFIVRKNQNILKGEKIGEIGPMYVDTPENAKYFDSYGQKTNGALTGPHLHLSIKKDGIAVNPLSYISSSNSPQSSSIRLLHFGQVVSNIVSSYSTLNLNPQ